MSRPRTPLLLFFRAMMLSAAIMVFPLYLQAVDPTPTAVYHAMQQVFSDLQELDTKRHSSTILTSTPRDTNKTPTDIYNRLHELDLLLRRYAKQHGHEIPKEFDIPRKTSGRKIFHHIVQPLEQIMKIAAALRKDAGVQDPPTINPSTPGKTPPDIYKLVDKSIALLESLM